MDEKRQSRLLGAFLLVAGAVLLWWVRRSALVEGAYYVKSIVIAPAVMVAGLGMLVHAPRIPIERMSPGLAFYCVLALAAGLINLHLLGAFRLGPAVVWPVVAGVAAVGLFAGFQALRSGRG